MKINNIFKLAISIAVSLLAGVIGSIFTMPTIDGWYAGIIKPAINPPAWVFGPVWTTLFVLMGISAFLIWSSYAEASEDKKKGIRVALFLFGIQLVLNTLWSIIFFGSTSLTINGLNNIGIAFVEIVFLWLAILATIVAFSKISRLAGWLLVPYILWVSFAGYLNFSIWMLNYNLNQNISMKGYVTNIEKLSLENDNFRKVLYTSKNSQLVLMSLLVGEEIGEEVHDVDQFLRVEKGSGAAILGGIPHDLIDGGAIVVPAGIKHNIINTGSEKMKLYAIYMPPHHRDGVIHKTKAEGEADTEHFDGKITE